jgi:integrase
VAERRLNFTKHGLEALPASEKRLVYLDTKEPGLRIRVEPTGTKSFFWQRKVNGERTKKSIGRFPDLTVEQARNKARDFNSQNAKWKSDDYTPEENPFERTDVPTLEEVLSDYIAKRCPKRKRPDLAAKSDREEGDRYLAPLLKKRLNQISRQDVQRLHVEIGSRKDERLAEDDRKPLHRTADKAIQFLRRLINWARNEMGWRGESPVPKDKSFWFGGNARKRYLKIEEAPAFWTALKENPNRDFQHYVILSAFTGARMMDILSMRWRDLSIEGDQPKWHVPETTKEEAYTVNLLAEAVEILRERHETNGQSEWVFPSDRGYKHKRGHITTVKTAWRTFLKKAGLKDFHRHDLRHTHASYMAINGASLLQIRDALGQKSIQSTQIYAELTNESVKDAQRIGVRALLTAGEAKVEGTPKPAPRKTRKKRGQ